jgi:L,D-peptidoglycan transpeptidase YkuD (ErfK/YbiS/YcfS/YnhG family)
MPLIVVRGLSRASTQGKLHLGALRIPCALGRGGRRPKGGEGDGITPTGCWTFRAVLYRPDRERRPATGLAATPVAPDFGWCDAPGDANYNRLVRLPYAASHERLWREDPLYDLLAVLGFNDGPRASGRGSAIFVHLARPGYTPTEGCIALARADMLRLLGVLRMGDRIHIA